MDWKRIEELANLAIKPWNPSSPRVIDAEIASVILAMGTAVNEAYAEAQESAVDAVMMWHDEPGPCAAVRSAIEALKLT